jgi:hypothetical protein
MSEAPKEYEHVEFAFSRSSGMLDGSSYDVTAYLLVPAEMMPALQQWTAAEAAGVKGNPGAEAMYDTLMAKGALLHREGGPAYREVERSMFDKECAKVTAEEYWEKGVRQESFAPRVRPLGKYTF